MESVNLVSSALIIIYILAQIILKLLDIIKQRKSGNGHSNPKADETQVINSQRDTIDGLIDQQVEVVRELAKISEQYKQLKYTVDQQFIALNDIDKNLAILLDRMKK